VDKEIDFDAPATYHIQLQECLGPERGKWFSDFTVTQGAAGGSILTGTVADRGALYGLIRKVRDLGLTMVSFERIEAQPDKGKTK
jgi:hypothetical protein